MHFVFQRAYQGPIRAVIFDWAGTTVDFGCMAPAAVFIDLFKNRGVAITTEQAREPMGMHKRDHIRAITQMEAVARAWREAHGRQPNEDDIESMFHEFVPALIHAVQNHSGLIPGVLEVMGELRNRNIAVGSTTGYSTEIMKGVRAEAERQGYVPDSVVCADQVCAARPAPWMALQSAMELNVYPMDAIVKVGDTPADISEGLNAGMWTAGIVRHGNEMGLTHDGILELAPAERDARLTRAHQRLAGAGAHVVIDSIGDLPHALDVIADRLAHGGRP